GRRQDGGRSREGRGRGSAGDDPRAQLDGADPRAARRPRDRLRTSARRRPLDRRGRRLPPRRGLTPAGLYGPWAPSGIEARHGWAGPRVLAAGGRARAARCGPCAPRGIEARHGWAAARRALGAGGTLRALGTERDRGAPRLRRGATSVGGFGGHFGAPI